MEKVGKQALHKLEVIMLTERQIKLLSKGKKIIILREGNEITIGAKPRAVEKQKIRQEIQRLKRKLRGM